MYFFVLKKIGEFDSTGVILSFNDFLETDPRQSSEMKPLGSSDRWTVTAKTFKKVGVSDSFQLLSKSQTNICLNFSIY